MIESWVYNIYFGIFFTAAAPPRFLFLFSEENCQLDTLLSQGSSFLGFTLLLGMPIGDSSRPIGLGTAATQANEVF